MMVCNDISVANHCLGMFKESFFDDRPSVRKHFAKGAAMYFVRLQCGHLHEALDVVREIKEDQTLFNMTERCSNTAQESFKELTDCLKDGPNRRKFEQYITRIRNNLAFHYCHKKGRKLIDRALSDRAGRIEAKTSTITLGNHLGLWRFELADDIIDSIVCRQIFGVPISADLRSEVDKILDFGSDLGKALITFGGEFATLFAKDHAVNNAF
jgi:hypothetical protein